MSAAKRTRRVPEQLEQAYALLAVDVIVFALAGGRLETLLVQLREGPFAGRWAFPGGRVRTGEALEVAATRQLSEKTGIAGIHLEQLFTFGNPHRDPHARVVSTAYLCLIPGRDRVPPIDKYAALRWMPADTLPELAYDHNRMARVALDRLRARVQYTNIVYGLLPEQFTLTELQETYETVLGRSLDRRNFRKRILATGLLVPQSAQRRGAHRPARLYAFAHRVPAVIRML